MVSYWPVVLENKGSNIFTITQLVREKGNNKDINAQEKAFTSRLFLSPEKLLRVREEKNLAVVISDKLTWDSHLHLITAKANKFLGQLKR